MSLKALSAYRLPILITENGVCTRDENLREEFIREHLAYVVKALGENIPVIGYLHWSLMDNYEWAEGYGPRFGLAHADAESGRRVIKKSGAYYAGICESHSIKDRG